jgi:hypothetical protein
MPAAAGGIRTGEPSNMATAGSVLQPGLPTCTSVPLEFVCHPRQRARKRTMNELIFKYKVVEKP